MFFLFFFVNILCKGKIDFCIIKDMMNIEERNFKQIEHQEYSFGLACAINYANLKLDRKISHLEFDDTLWKTKIKVKKRRRVRKKILTLNFLSDPLYIGHQNVIYYVLLWGEVANATKPKQRWSLKNDNAQMDQ